MKIIKNVLLTFVVAISFYSIGFAFDSEIDFKSKYNLTIGEDVQAYDPNLSNLEVGVTVQAYDADLTTYAGITPSSNVQSVLGASDYDAIKTLLDVDPTPISYLIDVSGDESTDLTTGDGKYTFRAPRAFTLTDIRASVVLAPTGAELIVDVTEGGTTILSTLLTIDAEVAATGTVTLATGTEGSVDSIEVNGVEIMSAPVNFTSTLAATATAVALDITNNSSSPNYTAAAVDEVITITAVTPGSTVNTFTVVSTATTITTEDVAMSGGVTDLSSESATVPAVISDTAIADDALISINVDQVGSTVAGDGLKIWLIGTL